MAASTKLEKTVWETEPINTSNGQIVSEIKRHIYAIPTKLAGNHHT